MRGFPLAIAVVAVGLVLAASGSVLSGSSPRGSISVTSGATVLVQPMTTVAIATSHGLAGYGVLAAKNVSSMDATWKVPKVHGKCPASKTEVAFAGLSLGGFVTPLSSFVGTETLCYGGSASVASYYSIAGTYWANTLTISAGDQVHAHITSTGSYVNILLQDKTKGTATTNSGAITTQKHTEALWVTAVGVSTTGTILPLVDFGNVTFTKCTAIINGTASHNLGHYSTTAIEMYNKANTAVKADVGVISSSNTSFTAFWKSAGP